SQCLARSATRRQSLQQCGSSRVARVRRALSRLLVLGGADRSTRGHHDAILGRRAARARRSVARRALRGATPSQTATFVFSLKAPLLSTPVVSLWQGVLAVPLIGTLDSHRTQVVMENLLQTIVTTGAQIAI